MQVPYPTSAVTPGLLKMNMSGLCIGITMAAGTARNLATCSQQPLTLTLGVSVSDANSSAEHGAQTL